MKFARFAVAGDVYRCDLAGRAGGPYCARPDAQGDRVIPIEDGELQRAQAPGPERVKPQNVTAEFDPGEAALEEVDGPAHRAEMDARLMRDRHLKRLPVVDDEGRVVRIVSRVDVLSVFDRRPDRAVQAQLPATRPV